MGWQVMALRSAQMAHLDVPAATLQRAMRYLDAAQIDSTGAHYGYMPGAGGSIAMTAEGLLCRQYLGWRYDEAGPAVWRVFIGKVA